MYLPSMCFMKLSPGYTQDKLQLWLSYMSIRCLRRWGCMSSGWIEGLQVSSVCKEEDASSPMKRFLYCYCYALFMFSCVSVWKLWRIMEFPCLHGNCGEGFVGLFQQQKHHWMLPLFELWSVRLHLKNPALCKGACWRVQCNMCY